MEEELDELEREEGTSEREKNQMLMAEEEYSVTKTPPPAEAKSAPYESVDGFSTTQPSFEFVSYEQSVELTRVEVWTAPVIVHPYKHMQSVSTELSYSYNCAGW